MGHLPCLGRAGAEAGRLLRAKEEDESTALVMFPSGLANPLVYGTECNGPFLRRETLPFQHPVDQVHSSSAGQAPKVLKEAVRAGVGQQALPGVGRQRGRG